MSLFLRTRAPVPPPRTEPASKPVSEPGTEPALAVAVVGSVYLAAALAHHLPAGYRVDVVDRLAEVTRPDVLVLDPATPAGVTAALRRHPGIPVIGLIGPQEPVETLIGVLEAGADTCVRAGETVLLASHLLACLRRRRVRSQATPSSHPAPSQAPPPTLRP